MNEWEKNLPVPSDEALQIAARCWCDKDTGSFVMNTQLATAFAKRIQALMDLLDEAIDEIDERDREELSKQGVDDAIEDSFF